MADIILIIILLIITSLAVGYIVKSKKQGKTCIGCPHASKCGGGCHSH